MKNKYTHSLTHYYVINSSFSIPAPYTTSIISAWIRADARHDQRWHWLAPVITKHHRIYRHLIPPHPYIVTITDSGTRCCHNAKVAVARHIPRKLRDYSCVTTHNTWFHWLLTPCHPCTRSHSPNLQPSAWGEQRLRARCPRCFLAFMPHLKTCRPALIFRRRNRICTSRDPLTK